MVAADEPVRLSAGAPGEPTQTGGVVLIVNGERLPLELTVPKGPVTVEKLLPILRGFSSLFSERAWARSEAGGQPISCRAGCGACCRQPVPLSDVEAEALLGVIDRLPPERRAVVRQRLEEAGAKLQAAGLAAALRRMGESGEDSPDVRTLADQYFRLGIACPFLEDEACSIYAERPIPCRAYVVTSPAALCGDVLSRDVRTVPVLQLSPALQSLTSDPAAPRRRWTVMTLLLERTGRAPATERQTGPHWIGRLLRAVQAMTTA